MPALGFGVYQIPPDETAEAVSEALRVGYRHRYRSSLRKRARGRRGHQNSGIDRDDIFIETKVWISDYGFNETLHAFEKARANSA